MKSKIWEGGVLEPRCAGGRPRPDYHRLNSVGSRMMLYMPLHIQDDTGLLRYSPRHHQVHPWEYIADDTVNTGRGDNK